MHARLVDQLNACLMTSEVPQWMTKGRTLLFVKDPTLGNGASNYRPITCLPLVFKLLTGVTFGRYIWVFRRERPLAG